MKSSQKFLSLSLFAAESVDELRIPLLLSLKFKIDLLIALASLQKI